MIKYDVMNDKEQTTLTKYMKREGEENEQ